MGLAARWLSLTSHPGVVMDGEPKVLINGMPAARAGDKHTCLMPPTAGPHPPNAIAGGSGSVFIGGLPAARVGDKTLCGAVITTGSGNVMIGD